MRRARWILIGVAVLGTISIVALNRKNSAPRQHYTLLEVIDVKGTCAEDHVGRQDNYAGQIVRWRTDETGKVSTYGSVMNTRGIATSAIEEIQQPTAYHTPFMVDFTEITVDTNQPQWTLHGISSRGENQQGYDSTCQLEVVKRGTELPKSQ